MADDDLLFPGYLEQGAPGAATPGPGGHYPYPYGYAGPGAYDAATALCQGTLFPWLDDHWRQRTDAKEAGPSERATP